MNGGSIEHVNSREVTFRVPLHESNLNQNNNANKRVRLRSTDWNSSLTLPKYLATVAKYNFSYLSLP